MRIVGIIPARLAATRLPHKPLLDICGKPMIQHVYERASQAKCLDQVLVATPDQEIIDAVSVFGGDAVITSERHRSGTDRLAEAAADLEADIIINIQGDEPLLDPATIDSATQALLGSQGSTPNAQRPLMTSLMCPCPEDELDNPACVKVVCDLQGNALYFSRSRIPFPRTSAGVAVHQHIGLYAYRKEFLLQFAAWPQSPLERTESLEQLRALEHGIRIRMVEVPNAPLSVDTPEDLDRVRRIIAGDS